MHNEIDFSKVERLDPRAESWDKVCARLDAMEHTPKAKTSSKFIQFPLRTTLPIVASFALIGIIVLITAFSHTESAFTESINIGEMNSWLDNLGNNDSDFEEMEEYESISHLIK